MSLVPDLYPDQIVDYAVQELAYEGSAGVSFDKLWELVSLKVNVDALYKKIIYSWLSKNDSIEILNDNQEIIIPKPKSFDEIEKGRYFIRVTSEFQWLSLTGSPRENNPVGGMAFDLLVEIAKSRQEGIDSYTLTKTTNQDARSLTSRIKVLSALIQKIPIIRNGRTLSLLILKKFYQPKKIDTIAVSNDEKNITISTDDIRGRIVSTLKAAKHGVRQVGDLRREMEMDKAQRIKRTFRSSVNYLEDKGYLAKVLVVSPAAPKRKFSALKYLKDYVPKADRIEDVDEEEVTEDEEEEEFDLNDQMIDDDLKNLEDEEPPTSLANVDNLEIKSSIDDTEIPLFNRFFPFQNQVFEMVDETETLGMSSIEILDSVFGRSYKRLFSKIIECYTTGKMEPHIANHGIERHYDFKGKVKFYRYLTRPNFLRLSNAPLDPNGSELPSFEAAKLPLETLNKKNYIPMNTGVELIENNGSFSIYWFGHSSDIVAKARAAQKARDAKSLNTAVVDVVGGDDDTPKRKRGRPKKGEERSTPKPKRTKKKENQPEKVQDTAEKNDIETQKEKVNVEVVTVEPTAENNGPQDNTKPDREEVPKDADKANAKEAQKEIVKPLNTLKISDLEGPSFKAIERLSVILKVLEENSGVMVNGFPLLDAVRCALNINVDKRTFKRDLQSLNSQGKIFFDEVFALRELSYKVVVLTSEDSQAAIDAFKETVKDKQKQKKAAPFKRYDELKNIDIGFYDNDIERSFNEVPETRASKRQKTKKSEIAKEIESESKEQPKLVKQKRPNKKESNSQKPVSEPKPRKRPVKPKQETHNDASDWDTNSKKARKPHGTRKKRNSSHLNSTETMLLFKAVIICKTINENQISWEKITKLFDGVSQEVLRKKWPRIRLMMGPEGSKTARRTWKRILLAAVREGKITLPEVEQLELETLVKLWQDAEIMGGVDETNDGLFANYEENFSHYNFVKNQSISNAFAYDSNSMIQREQYLVGKSFTYVEDYEEIKEGTPETYSNIRNIIIAILASGPNSNIRKLPLLESFDKKDIDEVFVEMTKRKEVVVGSDSKVILGETLTHILDDNSYDFSLQKVNHLHSILKNLFEANRGLVLDPIFDNSFMVPILELLNQGGLNLIRVDHYRREVLSGYEARTLEREKLDCDVILSKGDLPIKEASETSPLVPMGKPCSRIWVDVEGQINKSVWYKVNRAVLTSILSQPGITKSDLFRKLSPLLTRPELLEIIQWLKDAKSITEKEFQGLWLLPQWYSVFGV